MALITRMARLFRADIHAVLDRIEEPELLLKQSLREMEETFAIEQKRALTLKHESTLGEKRRQELTQTLSELEGQIDTCFNSGNEELARTLIRRKLGQQQQLKQLDQRGSELNRLLGELKNQLQENQCQLESMRQKVELLTAKEDEDRLQQPWSPLDNGIQDADVEVAFLHEKQKRGKQ